MRVLLVCALAISACPRSERPIERAAPPPRSLPQASAPLVRPVPPRAPELDAEALRRLALLKGVCARAAQLSDGKNAKVGCRRCPRDEAPDGSDETIADAAPELTVTDAWTGSFSAAGADEAVIASWGCAPGIHGYSGALLVDRRTARISTNLVGLALSRCVSFEDGGVRCSSACGPRRDGV